MSASFSKIEWDHWRNELGESHQTKIGFCRDNNPNYHQFLCWFEKYNKTSAKLIPVKIAYPKQPLVPQKSPIAKAINYTLRHWDGLTRFCEDGHYLIDNNHTEREIKPFIIARKNFLFAESQEGARALCLHFSLIRTAKQHKLDPYQYYVEIMKAVPQSDKAEDYEALLPWNSYLVKVTTKDR